MKIYFHFLKTNKMNSFGLKDVINQKFMEVMCFNEENGSIEVDIDHLLNDTNSDLNNISDYALTDEPLMDISDDQSDHNVFEENDEPMLDMSIVNGTSELIWTSPLHDISENVLQIKEEPVDELNDNETLEYVWNNHVDIKDYKESWVNHWKYTCKICHERFQTKKKLLSHTAQHKCPKCLNLFKGCNINAHMSNCTANGPIVQPRNVQNVYQKKHTKKKEIKINSRKELKKENCEIPCSDCDMVFSTESALEVHQKNIHVTNGQCFSCPVCHIKVKRESAFRCHLRTHGGDDSELMVVSNTSSVKTLMERGTNTIEIDNKLKSEQNQEMPIKTKGKAKITIKNNKKQMNMTVNPKQGYLCHCGQRYKTSRALNHHKGRVHFDYSYIKGLKQREKICRCHICDKLFRDIYNLRKHVEAQHTTGRKYMCQECNHTYKSKHDLQVHAKELHATGNSYSCVKCKKDMIFRTVGLFQKHLDLHQSKSAHILLRLPSKKEIGTNKLQMNVTVKPKQGYLCHCGQRYKTSGALNHHKGKVHFDYSYKKGPKQREKMCRCHVCDKLFRDNYNLRKHLEVQHTLGRKYTCQECNHTYKTKYDLQVNAKDLHATGNSYPCAKCKKDMIFRTEVLFEKHLDLHQSKSAHILLRLPSKNINGTNTCLKKPQQNLQEMDDLEISHLSSMNEHIEEKKIVNKNPVSVFNGDEVNGTEITIEVQPSKDRKKTKAGQLIFRTGKTADQHNDDVHKGIPHTKSDNNQRCTKCFQYFADEYNFQEHIKMCHSQTRDFKCTECNKSYLTRNTLRKHIKVTHEHGKNYYCKICKKNIAFITEKKYKNHVASHNDGATSIVLHSPVNSKPLVVVKEKETNTNYTFQEVDNIDTNDSEDGFEIEIDNGEDVGELWSCSLCYKEFAYEEDLQKHQCINQALTTSTYHCKTEQELQQHEDAYHDCGKKYHYPVCKNDIIVSKPDSYDEHLNLHMQNIHTTSSDHNSATRMVPDCSTTSMDFPGNQVTEEKPNVSRKSQSWTCSRCNIEFESVKNLIIHKCPNKNCINRNITASNGQLKQTKQQSWKCSKCTIEFPRVRDLIQHTRTHR